MKKDDCVVVVPTYNNPLSIHKVAQDVLNHGYTVILVDDGSSIPVSSLVPEQNNLTIVRHDVNQAKVPPL